MNKSYSTLREEYDIPGDAILIGNVGNLYPVKGQQYLIRAFASVLLSFSRAYLVLVGRGGEEINLRKLVKDVGIPSDRVVFTGFRKDIENVMNSFDLYVQPSLTEGHPIAVLEAISLGIPVIATDVGGNPEILDRNRYGTLVTPACSESLHRAIIEILVCHDQYLQRAVLARDYVIKNYSIEKMASDYLDVYHNVLDVR